METVFKFLIDLIGNYLGVLNGIVFVNFFGFNVSYLDIIFGFLILGMFISIFWKGAKA